MSAGLGHTSWLVQIIVLLLRRLLHYAKWQSPWEHQAAAVRPHNIENVGTDIVNASAGVFHKHVNPPPPLVIKEWDFGDQGALLIHNPCKHCHLQLKLHLKLHLKLLLGPLHAHINCIVDVLSRVCCFTEHQNPWSRPEPDM